MTMHRSTGCLSALLIFLLLFPAARGDERTPVDPPLTVQVYLRDARNPLGGKLVAYDESVAVIQTPKEQRQVAWAEMTAPSAYTLRARLIDKSDARQWLELGTFGWRMGAKQARYALDKAASMDGSLRQEVDAVLKTEPGELVSRAPRRAATDASPDPEAQVQPAHEYERTTPEESAAAIAAYRARGKQVQERLRTPLEEIQTDHFLIFTDWDPREYAFLKTNLEAAYATVSRQFNLPVTGNVFVGKLPVYMLAERDTFKRLAREIDGTSEYMAEHASGYYYGRSDGIGHMVMWKPDIAAAGGNVRLAERRWAYVLTHEFTHAFVARYKSNRHIPTWLNEGIAEMIAADAFPDNRPLLLAKDLARQKVDITPVFEDQAPKTALQYPVMRTLVELLASENHKAFQAMFDDIKSGTPGEEALQKHYGVNYDQLTQLWREWIIRR